MTLHPKKQQIQPVSHGIPFVGYFIKPTGVTVRRNVVKIVKNKLHQYCHHPSGNISALTSTLNSYYGHFRQARSYNLRQHLFKKHLSPNVQSKLWIVGQWQYFKPAKNKSGSSPQKNRKPPRKRG
jgi:hypothetical protein